MNNVIQLPTAPTEITPAELKSLLGWLGLTRPWLAARLNVGERTVIRWEDGKARMSEAASVELVRVWNYAADSIRTMIEAAQSTAVDGVITLRTFRVDSEYHEQTGQTDYPASWHRALTCRAMDHILMRTRYQVQIEYWGSDATTEDV